MAATRRFNTDPHTPAVTLDSVLTLRAGDTACRHLQTHGLSAGHIGALTGAAGGPKWLILSALDQYLFGDWLANAAQPVQLVGSSIGAWRFAAACHPRDPAGAITELENAYLAQSYSAQPDRDEISKTLRAVLDRFFCDAVLHGVLEHPRYALHVVTVRSRGLTASERRGPQAVGSALGALANGFARRALSGFYERVVFSRASAPTLRWAADGLGARTVALTAANARDAVHASGSIPLLMRAVMDPVGAPAGVYRDGGLVDYHLDQPLLDDSTHAPLVLMPHFDRRLIPGWFDKRLVWRRPRFAANTLMVGPGPGLLARLANRRVPDRKDFHRYAGDDAARLVAWRRALDAGKYMRDAFAAFAECDDPARFVKPL